MPACSPALSMVHMKGASAWLWAWTMTGPKDVQRFGNLSTDIRAEYRSSAAT